MSLAVQCWIHGVELVTAAGTLPDCLKLWDPSGRSTHYLGDRDSDSTPQVHIAAGGAMGDWEKPGQMSFPELVSPRSIISFSTKCPPVFRMYPVLHRTSR